MQKYKNQYYAIFLMTLGWSMGGLFRNSLTFAFPMLSQEFALSSQHNGYLAATMALFWMLSIILNGARVEKRGQISVLLQSYLGVVIALLLFLFANNVIVLYCATALMGFGAGAVVPASLSFLAVQTEPDKRGLAYGIPMACYTLIGAAIGSVLLIKIGDLFSWRAIFFTLFVLFAVVIGILYFSEKKVDFLPNPKAEASASNSVFKALQYYNVKIAALMAGLSMAWYFITAAYTILYLMDSGYDMIVSAGIFAGFGIGGFLGEAILPALSDKTGRKRTVVVAMALGAISFFGFVVIPMNAWGMTLALGSASLFMSGAMDIVATVIPSESVPEHLISSATTLTTSIGECVGGIMGPFAIGAVLSLLTFQQVYIVLAVVPFIVLLCAILLKKDKYHA